MLVIRRRAGESFFIDRDVEVQVLEVGFTQVKLGITAPKDVSILRREAHLTEQQNQAASQELSARALTDLAARLRH